MKFTKTQKNILKLKCSDHRKEKAAAARSFLETCLPQLFYVLNPATPLSYIQHYIHLVDKITIMSVDPGFAGQPFIREMLSKIAEAKRLKEENGYKYIIEVDGSCNSGTFKELAEAGTECFIVGTSGLFNLDEDLTVAWDKMIENFNACVNA